MSLNSALAAGVSGLSAEASAMASVADNISNVNTIGYKSVETQFSTLVGDGRITNSYSAGGVTAAPRALISKQGLLQASASSTDLGIAGQGFFIVRTGADRNSPIALTRAGSFAPDQSGYLKNSSGMFLQGWRLDATKTPPYSNVGTTENMEPIRMTDLTGTAAPTTKFQLRANFQSTTVAKTGYVAGELASGAKPADYTKPFVVYDAQGGAHPMKLSVIKTDANTWQAEIYADPANQLNTTTYPGGVVSKGTIKFDGSGALDRAASTPAFFEPLFKDKLSATPPAEIWANKASAVPITVAFGDTGTTNGFSQSNAASADVSSSIDGGPLGNVDSVSISETGVVSAVFQNGTSRAVFQLPLATVPNPEGLARITGNSFVASDQSGAYAINAPGSLGAGKVSGYKLEASTADLAQEFTNMIRFQRAYSAASKIITTVDDMLQEVTNLKR